MPKKDPEGNAKDRWNKRLIGVGCLYPRSRPGLAALLLAGLFVAGPVPAGPAGTVLNVDSEVATAGFFRLDWGPGAGPFELQEATAPDFGNTTTLYHGSDLATVISGKQDGTWYYRVRASTTGRQDAWSEPVTVTVAHHELGRALQFLSLGFVIFVAISLTVMRGRVNR